MIKARSFVRWFSHSFIHSFSLTPHHNELTHSEWYSTNPKKTLDYCWFYLFPFPSILSFFSYYFSASCFVTFNISFSICVLPLGTLTAGKFQIDFFSLLFFFAFVVRSNWRTKRISEQGFIFLCACRDGVVSQIG